MRTFLSLCFCFLSTGSIIFCQSGVELKTDGIILPNLVESEIPPTSIPGHIIFNATKNRLEIFSQNFQWEGINGNRLIDNDQDSEIYFEEGASSDLLKINLDNSLKLTIQTNTNGIPRLVLNGSLNTFLGAGAGDKVKSQGFENIAIGTSALANNRTADYNIAIGTRALFQSNIDDDMTLYGNNNVAIGHEAGMTGAPNNSVFIGPFAGKNAATISNALYISNTEGDNPLIYGEFGNKLVRINGDLQTDARSIFMRNLGGTDSDEGLKWGESSIQPVFGITYDGTGSGGDNKLKIREYIGTQSDIMTIKADGNISMDKLTDATTGLMVVQPDGTITRQAGMQWVMISPYEVDPFFTERKICIGHSSGPPTGCPKEVILPIKIPHGAILKRIKVFFHDDDNASWLNVSAYSYNIITENETIIGEFNSDSGSSDIRTHIIDINDVVIDNENLHYDISLNNFGFTGNSFVHGLAVGYEYQ